MPIFPSIVTIASGGISITGTPWSASRIVSGFM
jgi:hypothetical protein